MNTESLAITLTRQLIRIASTDPGSMEGAIGEFLYQLLSHIPGAIFSRNEVLPGRYNLMAELPGDRRLPALVFLCHMDTVVVGEGWTKDPFGAEESDGHIFGRGAEAVIRDGWIQKEDWIMDMEPTDGQIQVAHKGRTWFEVTVEGCTAHASTPWKGADAIAGILRNPNSMSYGPGSLELAHKPDESVPIADILRCEQVLCQLIMS